MEVVPPQLHALRSTRIRATLTDGYSWKDALLALHQPDNETDMHCDREIQTVQFEVQGWVRQGHMYTVNPLDQLLSLSSTVVQLNSSCCPSPNSNKLCVLMMLPCLPYKIVYWTAKQLQPPCKAVTIHYLKKKNPLWTTLQTLGQYWCPTQEATAFTVYQRWSHTTHTTDCNSQIITVSCQSTTDPIITKIGPIS